MDNEKIIEAIRLNGLLDGVATGSRILMITSAAFVIAGLLSLWVEASWGLALAATVNLMLVLQNGRRGIALRREWDELREDDNDEAGA